MTLSHFATPRIEAIEDAGGSVLLRSKEALAPHARCVGDWLEAWAAKAPERVFLSEPSGDVRRAVTYGEARARVRAIARGLLDLGATPERPVMILSDNAIDNALVQLAAMHVGVPAAPVSPAYSLVSKDFRKLRDVASCLGPSIIYASDAALFAPAIDALGLGVTVVASAGAGSAIALGELSARRPNARVDEAFAAIGPDTIAKVLFTSGSTGAPKGVVNTQRMLCSNQQAIAQVWPLLDRRPPVIVDWLPWSHTFGGNHNFNMILRSGGTLHIDAGRPVPGKIEETVRALKAVSPTLYFNVPRGFDVLLPFLETDEELAATFFRELDLLFYAAAALPQSSWERLARVAKRHRDGGVPFVSAWGSTETAPLVTSVHFAIDRAGVIGVPAPACEVKLVPERDRREIRVRGPNVTPGAWERGGHVRPVELDDEGFLRTGDAGRLADARDPSRGIVFDGRTAENFKLSSGTWVSVGELRIRLVAACAPHVADIVIAGHDKDEIAILLFPAPGAQKDAIVAALCAHNAASPSSSTRVARALVLREPPSIDRGEITDKGYVNQRAVLTHRASFVARLYALEPDDDVLVIP